MRILLAKHGLEPDLEADRMVAELASAYASQHGPFPSRAAFVRYNERAIAALHLPGVASIKSMEDSAGNCLICGEAGRCPGVHAVRKVKNLLK
jgi:hypothetical protein